MQRGTRAAATRLSPCGLAGRHWSAYVNRTFRSCSPLARKEVLVRVAGANLRALPLSYRPLVDPVGIEPTTPTFSACVSSSCWSTSSIIYTSALAPLCQEGTPPDTVSNTRHEKCGQQHQCRARIGLLNCCVCHVYGTRKSSSLSCLLPYKPESLMGYSFQRVSDSIGAYDCKRLPSSTDEDLIVAKLRKDCQ